MEKKQLETQKFLRGGGTLADLEQRFAIKAKRHGSFPELVLLKYNQLESDFASPLVRECRGLILNESESWDAVAVPYFKFFNLGESHAAPIDWKTAKVQEKLDGSLITLYFYKNVWHVATSGTPDANCKVGDSGKTFRELFLETCFKQGCDLSALDPGHTYMGELCTPYNNVVVRYKTSRVYLHGVRCLDTLQEIDCTDAATRAWFCLPASYLFTSPTKCLEMVRKLDPLENEGFVVCDADFNRVKIKSPAYVALHHSKDGLMSRRNIAEVIRRGEGDEYLTALAAFPELAQEFYRLHAMYEALVLEAHMVYDEIRSIESRKELAEKTICRIGPSRAGIVFSMLKGCSAKEAVLRLSSQAYLRLMGIKE